MAWLSFIELDKVVVRVTDWLVVCECGFSLSALSQRLPSYLDFSYLGHGVSLHCSPAKHSHCSLLGSRVAPLG